MWQNPLWYRLIDELKCQNAFAGQIAVFLINLARDRGIDCYPQIINNGPMIELMTFNHVSIAEAFDHLANFAGCEVVYSPSQDIRENGFGVSFIEKAG